LDFLDRRGQDWAVIFLGLFLGGRPTLPNVGGSPTKKTPWESSFQGFIPRNHAFGRPTTFPRNTLDGFQTFQGQAIPLGAVQLGGSVFHWFSDVKVHPVFRGKMEGSTWGKRRCRDAKRNVCILMGCLAFWGNLHPIAT